MNDTILVICREFKNIAKNIPILIVLILGNIGYGFLYNLLYNTNVYREAPVAVVDMSQSDLSRHLADYINSTQEVNIICNTENFKEAEEMLLKREIVGFLYIPSELKSNLAQNIQTHCIIYGSTLSFLDYLNISEAVNYACLQINSELITDVVENLNIVDVLFLANGKAVNITTEALYNTNEGYGTYLIPPVIVIIIFQTMMICIAMMCGKENGSARLNSGFILRRKNAAFKIVLGKALCNVMIYTVLSVFFLGFLPQLFNLSHLGKAIDIIIMMIPYLFATAFFCLSLSPFFTDSDMPLFIIVFMSVPLVFISGISYPLELMPWYWKIFHYIIPVGPATLAFVKMNCMGASLNQVSGEILNLWIQCFFYLITSVLVWKYVIIRRISKAKNKKPLKSI